MLWIWRPFGWRMRSKWMLDTSVEGGTIMLLVTTNTIEAMQLETLGLVKGEIVQSKHIGKDFAAGFKTIIGGEIAGYTEMMSEARVIATQRMLEDAKRLGADAVVGVRYASAAIMQGAAEILVYGTAVKYKT